MNMVSFLFHAHSPSPITWAPSPITWRPTFTACFYNSLPSIEFTKHIHNHFVGDVNVELGGFGGLNNNVPIFWKKSVGKPQHSSVFWVKPTSIQDIGMLIWLRRLTSM